MAAGPHEDEETEQQEEEAQQVADEAAEIAEDTPGPCTMQRGLAGVASCGGRLAAADGGRLVLDRLLHLCLRELVALPRELGIVLRLGQLA